MFEPELFRKQMYCIEEILVALLGLFGAPCSDSAPHIDSAPEEVHPLALPLRSAPEYKMESMPGQKQLCAIYSQCLLFHLQPISIISSTLALWLECFMGQQLCD